MELLRLVVADDHDIVRRGLRDLLEAHVGWKVVAEASTGTDAVTKVRETRPDDTRHFDAVSQWARSCAANHRKRIENPNPHSDDPRL